MENTFKAENCTIDQSATVGQMSVLINSMLGEMCMVGNFSKMAYSSMDRLSYIGDSTVVINTNIGKFCSISWGVTLGPEEHDYTRLTSHSFLYSLKSFSLTPHKHYSPFEKECKIGNDVWIGCNSTVLRGVVVGDGAVIGANALVTKDVPPYAIVVGSPAKILKYRFEKSIIEELMNLQWWNLPIEVISAHTELFAEHPSLESISKIKRLSKP